MLKRFPALLAALFVLALPASQFALEPANVNKPSGRPAIRDLREYGRDLAAVRAVGQQYLTDASPACSRTQKLAIVFDIDETALTNLSEILDNDFGYVPAVWKHWVAEHRAPAIVPVQVVYEKRRPP